VKLRTDVSKRVTEKRMYRRNRRSRRRYRKPRFLNRKKNQVLAPSVKQKVDSHIKIIDFVKSILPITQTIVEAGKFDPYELKNPDVKGTDYQKGEQFGYENVKAYVLVRDGYKCFFSKGCSKKLHVHHIVFRSNGGSNAESNLITLCEKHHDQLHKGKIKLPPIKHKSLKSA
ncbi:MAG: RRXRR domain-containing protein, partial [Deltaproteobacteria bacterium]|nr:RRXRR domain-containing protein [Deltaproteobacteria bacterium]